jgi:hypothetical protein
MEWITRYCSIYEWSCLTSKGVVPNLDKDQLSRFFNRKGFAKKMTQSMLRQHMDGTGEVLYTRALPWAPEHLFLIDIDPPGHGKRQGDALDLSEHVLSLLPAYREPSTHYSGFHHYLLLDRERLPHAWVAEFLQILARALDAIAKENHFDSTVEVLGSATLTDTTMGLWTMIGNGAPRSALSLSRARSTRH